MAKPPKKSAGDTTHSVVKAGLSLIPVIGGSAAELFNLVLAPPLERRRNEWMNSVAEALKELEEKVQDFDLERLAENESFITATLHATRVALQSHQQEKLQALRNAVLNASLQSAPDHDLQSIFLNHIEAMTPWHLKILAWLKDPDDRERNVGGKHVNLPAATFAELLQQDFPELKGRGDFYVQILRDLRDRGLIGSDDTRSLTRLERDFHGPRTTGLGDQFLAYIRIPIN